MGLRNPLSTISNRRSLTAYSLALLVALGAHVCAPHANARAGTTPEKFEKRIDAIELRIEQTEKLIGVRLDDLAKIRAAELKALDDKYSVAKEVAEIKKDVANNAQQTVNWWLAVVALFFAAVGIVAPILITRDLRSKYELATAEVSTAKDAIATMKTEIESERHIVTTLKSDVETQLAQAAAMLSQIRENKQRSEKLLSEGLTAVEELKKSALNLARDGGNDNDKLSALAKRVSTDESIADKDRLFAQGVAAFLAGDPSTAAARFEAVVAVDPSHQALYNWGVALGELADVADDTERTKLREEEIAKYDAALKVEPNLHEALNNWGFALAKLGDDALGERRARLRQEEIAKYDAALKIKPNLHQALNNWGFALLKNAHDFPPQREHWIDEAERLLRKAESIAGHASYNLACVFAMRGDAAKFIETMARVPRKDWPSKDHLASDKDLDGIRETPEFKRWMQEHHGD